MYFYDNITTVNSQYLASHQIFNQKMYLLTSPHQIPKMQNIRTDTNLLLFIILQLGKLLHKRNPLPAITKSIVKITTTTKLI